MNVNDCHNLAAMNKLVEADTFNYRLQQQPASERGALLKSRRLAEEAGMERLGDRCIAW
jgi:hypothetical protein